MIRKSKQETHSGRSICATSSERLKRNADSLETRDLVLELSSALFTDSNFCCLFTAIYLVTA